MDKRIEKVFELVENMHASKKRFTNSKKKPVAEDTDGIDTVTLEIPALIRALEWAREDAKNDVEIHKFVEKLINHEGTVDMRFFSEAFNTK